MRFMVIEGTKKSARAGFKGWLIIAAALAVALWQLPWILSQYPKLFEVDNARPGADAIVLLGGEPLSRTPGAVEAYRQGYGPVVWVTSVREPSDRFARYFFTETQRVASALSDEQVPHEIIASAKGGATSTLDEAWDVAQKIRRDRPGVKRLILATDGFHTRRARYAFEKVFKKAGLTVAIECYAAPNERYTRENWWKTEKGISAYFLETIKWMIYPFIDSNVAGIEES